MNQNFIEEMRKTDNRNITVRFTLMVTDDKIKRFADYVVDVMTPIEDRICAFFADGSKIFNNDRHVEFKQITCEPDLVKLDGTFTIPYVLNEPARNYTSPFQVGMWSKEICDGNGEFETNPIFAVDYSDNAFPIPSVQTAEVITISFDNRLQEYAEDFIIRTIVNEEVVKTFNITGNTDYRAIVEEDFGEFQTLEVEIVKWGTPNRRARMVEIDFGYVKEYGRSDVIEFNVVEEIDPTCTTLPTTELNLTLNNIDREFNLLDPQSIAKHLNIGNQITMDMGVIYPNGIEEYMQFGIYYLKDWDVQREFVTFTAGNFIDYVSNIQFDEQKIYDDDKTEAHDLLLDVFNYLPNFISKNIPNIQFSLPSLKKIGSIYPINNVRECLRLISEATCGALQHAGREYSPFERFVLANFNDGYGPSEETPSVTKEMLHEQYPRVSLDKKVKEIEVFYYTYTPEEEVEIFNEFGDYSNYDIEGQTMNSIKYVFDGSYIDVNIDFIPDVPDLPSFAVIEKTSYNSVIIGFAGYTSTSPIIGTLIIRGKPLRTKKTSVLVPVSDEGERITIDNPLVVSEGYAYKLGNEYKKVYLAQKIFEFNWIQFPVWPTSNLLSIAIENENDIVWNITPYRNEFKYNGTLKGTTKGRG